MGKKSLLNLCVRSEDSILASCTARNGLKLEMCFTIDAINVSSKVNVILTTITLRVVKNNKRIR